MDKGLLSQIETYIHMLNDMDIKVTTVHHTNGHITVTAEKSINNNIQHVSITSDNLFEAIYKLFKYIENEIEDWIIKELY